MKRIVKIFCLFLFSLIIVGLNKSAQANSISKISMDIYIQDNGDAIVTEEWNCNTSEGTEVYHPYYNLGNSEIKNLKVKENGKMYKTIPYWNTSGTLSEKANKCGINQIKKGVELCWGMGSYGTHTYTAQYTITKFVSQLTDSQMIYWTLIPYEFSNPIENVHIKIHTSFNISNNTDIWGYGNYGGTAYAHNGYIEMQSDGKLDKDEYMTILVKFPSGTFNTTNVLNNDFNYYYDMAQTGAVEHNKYLKTCIWIGIIILGLVFSMGTNILIGGAHDKLLTLMKSEGKVAKLNFGSEGKHISKSIPYYRDIPCQGDLFKAYYIGYQYGLLKNKTDIVGAIILKWLKESIIRIEQKEEGKVFKKENTRIILNETDTEKIENSKEGHLFSMLYKASKDGILENKEFKEWCNISYEIILKWFDDILEEQREILTKEGLIVKEQKNILKSFKYTTYTATPELKEEAIKLAALKKFLREYTLIEDKEAIEVQLFEEYLIYAQMMGIAKQVAKEFENLYPEVIQQSNYDSYDNILFIGYYTSRGVMSAMTASERAKAMEHAFSSGGGGGGSFGGGGGGRRLPLIRKKQKRVKSYY